MVPGIKEETSAQEDAKPTAQRTVGQSVKKNWDCSQIKKRRSGGRGRLAKGRPDGSTVSRSWRRSWSEEGWKETHCSWKSCKRVSELVVHERMTKGKEVKCTKEEKRVKGWSIEEMKDKVNSLVEIDTKEMIKWRGLSQEEINQCWKNFTEKLRLRFWTSTRSRKAKLRLFKGRGAPLEWRRVRGSKKYRKKWREDCWARIFALFREYNLQRLQSKQEESAEEEEMKQQQRFMKDLTKKISPKGRMDAESRWWVTELLVADCEKAWIHPGWEDTMQK